MAGDPQDLDSYPLPGGLPPGVGDLAVEEPVEEFLVCFDIRALSEIGSIPGVEFLAGIDAGELIADFDFSISDLAAFGFTTPDFHTADAAGASGSATAVIQPSPEAGDGSLVQIVVDDGTDLAFTVL